MINLLFIKNKVFAALFFICLFFYAFLLYNGYGGKVKKIIILIITIFMVTGCGNKTYHEISYDELDQMLEEKDDFILFIGSSTCSACASYSVTLNGVIEDYGTDVKYIDISKLSKAEESRLVSLFPIDGTPTTVFIEDGEEKSTFNRIEGAAKRSKITDKFQENNYIKG